MCIYKIHTQKPCIYPRSLSTPIKIKNKILAAFSLKQYVCLRSYITLNFRYILHSLVFMTCKLLTNIMLRLFMLYIVNGLTCAFNPFADKTLFDVTWPGGLQSIEEVCKKKYTSCVRIIL